MMKFTTPKKHQLENFIIDWHWDQESHQFAQELGAFLFGFMDYLVQSGASDRVCRTHHGNLWNIGIFTCQYGYHKQFSPDIFKQPPFHEIEFRRKISDTAYALKSYSATCNQLSKYATKRLYINVEPDDPGLFNQIEDFMVGLKLMEMRNSRLFKRESLDFKQEIKILQGVCVHAPGELNSRQISLENKNKCIESLESVAMKLTSFPAGDHYSRSKIQENLLSDVQVLRYKFGNLPDQQPQKVPGC